MGQKSNIQWTDHTWNIARGCTKVDEDCKFCYMYRESLNGTRYEPKEIIRTKTVFNLPYKIKEPSKIFTSSLTDFFHEDIDSYRSDAWDIIRDCPHHTFQILTKRPERINDHLPPDWGDKGYPAMKNVWFGTSIGHDSDQTRQRLQDLVDADVFNKFLSLEPLHGPIDFDKINCPGCGNPLFDHGIDWVIVGGESGNENGNYRYRPCQLEWIESIVEFCQLSMVPVFVKQLGTHLAKKMGLKDRHGGDPSEWPAHIRVQQFPKETE